MLLHITPYEIIEAAKDLNNPSASQIAVDYYIQTMQGSILTFFLSGQPDQYWQKFGGPQKISLATVIWSYPRCVVFSAQFTNHETWSCFQDHCLVKDTFFFSLWFGSFALSFPRLIAGKELQLTWLYHVQRSISFLGIENQITQNSWANSLAVYGTESTVADWKQQIIVHMPKTWYMQAAWQAAALSFYQSLSETLV